MYCFFLLTTFVEQIRPRSSLHFFCRRGHNHSRWSSNQWRQRSNVSIKQRLRVRPPWHVACHTVSELCLPRRTNPLLCADVPPAHVWAHAPRERAVLPNMFRKCIARACAMRSGRRVVRRRGRVVNWRMSAMCLYQCTGSVYGSHVSQFDDCMSEWRHDA